MAENIAPRSSSTPWDKENDISALKTVKKGKSSESKVRRSRRGLRARPNGGVDAGAAAPGLTSTKAEKVTEGEEELDDDHTDVIIALPVRSRRSGRRRRRRELVQEPIAQSPEDKDTKEEAKNKTSDDTTFESAIEFKTTKPLELDANGGVVSERATARSGDVPSSSATTSSSGSSGSMRWVFGP